MGSERRSKEKKMKSRRRSPSLSSSEDEGKSRKRQRREEEEEEEEKRSRKSDKKEKRKDRKSHRHRDDNEKKSKDKHKSKQHKRDRPLKGEFHELSNDDYYSKNNEFATWLKEESKKFFSDLSSESARELFSEFVKDWNDQKLESRYYKGISSGPRSAHNWTFKKKRDANMADASEWVHLHRDEADIAKIKIVCSPMTAWKSANGFHLFVPMMLDCFLFQARYAYEFLKIYRKASPSIPSHVQSADARGVGPGLGEFFHVSFLNLTTEAKNCSSTTTLTLTSLARKLSTLQLPAILSRQNSTFNPKLAISTIPLPCQETNTNPGTFLSLLNHPNPEISCFFQKGFSQITQLATGKALHALCIKGFVKLGVFCNNTLINMYSKFGRVGQARYLLDKMPEKNEASWNNMMSGFVRGGFYWESISFFNEMRDFGIQPSGFAVASLITACDRCGLLLSEGIQVHGFVLKIGLLCDVFVGTSLLHFYGSYGLPINANRVFEEMPVKNVVSWTALMVAYSDYGDPGAVMNIYQYMRREGLSYNENSLATVISSCGSLEGESLGHQVLGHVIKSGLETNVSVANALISMFGSFGSMKEACYIFYGMNEHDIISWNSMISANVRNGLSEESLRCFYCMRHVHMEINSTTISTLLSVCGSVENVKWGRGIHCLAMKFGLVSNVCLCNTLISMYADAGKPKDSELVFQGMVEKDLISWNSMLACYSQHGMCLDALKIFCKLFHIRKSANFVTFTSTLAACSEPEFITEGKILHALVILTGLHDDLIVGNALITLYAKSGMMVEAKKVFQAMTKRDAVSWNVLIGGHADNEESDEAVKAFKMMREEGIPAVYITIANVLGACVAPNALLKHGMTIHAYIVMTGFDTEEYVQNSLIMMYARCGDLNSSNSIFDGLKIKNAISWNAIISANAHHGKMEEALKLLVKMRRLGIDLDQFSLSECLAATAKLAILEEGQQLHGLAVKLGFDLDNFVTNATMDMYGKCGEIDDVLRIIPQPMERSRLSWNILTSSFARCGYFEMAKEAFNEMVRLGVRPDHVTFVSLLSACSHGGLVEEGLAYYDSMTKEYGVPAGIEHCVCIIDLLGRSGRFPEAERFIEEMPVPATDLVWRSLLAACNIHGNLELGKKAAENLLKLDPADDSAYVLYSNVYATTGRWDDMENVRRRMGSIKKKPACSWVKLKNKLSSFGMGDQSHPQTSEIYAKLEDLKKMIKEAGYVPDTTYALQDIDEEQREQNLWNHSERLALAFSLIKAPEGSTIKIFKNLRVCADCHSVYKFVSGTLGRKILLRDPYRFHHFSAGKCSCSDYW